MSIVNFNFNLIYFVNVLNISINKKSLLLKIYSLNDFFLFFNFILFTYMQLSVIK